MLCLTTIYHSPQEPVNLYAALESGAKKGPAVLNAPKVTEDIPLLVTDPAISIAQLLDLATGARQKESRIGRQTVKKFI